MVFIRKDGTYSGTDIIKYPFKIIHHELGISCRFYDLRGNFATKTLRKGREIKDISKVLGHSRIETTENYITLAPTLSNLGNDSHKSNVDKDNTYYLPNSSIISMKEL